MGGITYSSLLQHSTWILGCLILTAFFVSPALLSIAMALLLIVGILTWASDGSAWHYTLKVIMFLCLALLLLHAFSWGFSQNLAEAQRKFLVKLPFFLTPLLMVALIRVQPYYKWIMITWFCYAVYVTGTVSTLVYLMNRAYFDFLILQAKPIPISFGYGIFHIHFSFLNALASFIGLGVMLGYANACVPGSNAAPPKWCRLLIMVVTPLNIINLHWLSARTGLLGFYVALLILAAYMFFTIQKQKQLILILLMLCLPVFAYMFSGSFKNRMINSYEDLTTIVSGDNPNDKSVAMRVEAWKTSLFLIQKYPLIGVGLGDLEPALQEAFLDRGTLLLPENRKNPHNQFLETAVHVGIPGFLLLLALFVYYIRVHLKNGIIVGITGIMLASFFFESLLERQVGVYAVAFFLALLYEPKETPV